jgi:ribosomal-protein-alanine N-acetyltransferase
MPINLRAFEEFPVLKTERLTLRDIRPMDADEIFRMRASGRVNQFIPRPNMADPLDAAQLIERIQGAYRSQQAIAWAGVLRNNHRIIGTCGLNHLEPANRRAELGGELAVDYWGKSLALEAVGAIVRFGLETLGLHSIEAKVSPDNRGAIYLLETLGFRKEAHYVDRVFFKGHFSDMAVYSLVQDKGNPIQ